MNEFISLWGFGEVWGTFLGYVGIIIEAQASHEAFGSLGLPKAYLEHYVQNMLLEFGSNLPFKRNLFESKMNLRHSTCPWWIQQPWCWILWPKPLWKKNKFQSQNQSPPVKTKMKHVQTLFFFWGGSQTRAIWQGNMCWKLVLKPPVGEHVLTTTNTFPLDSGLWTTSCFKPTKQIITQFRHTSQIIEKLSCT